MTYPPREPPDDGGPIDPNVGYSGPPGGGYARLNFATSPAILAEGVHRMATAVKRGTSP